MIIFCHCLSLCENLLRVQAEPGFTTLIWSAGSDWHDDAIRGISRKSGSSFVRAFLVQASSEMLTLVFTREI